MIKYPIGSIGYYKEMTSYKTPEHLREDYELPLLKIRNKKFKRGKRAKIVKLKSIGE